MVEVVAEAAVLVLCTVKPTRDMGWFKRLAESSVRIFGILVVACVRSPISACVILSVRRGAWC